MSEIIRRPFFLLPSLLYCCDYLATRTFDSSKVQGSGRKWPLYFLIIYWTVDKLTDLTVHVCTFRVESSSEISVRGASWFSLFFRVVLRSPQPLFLDLKSAREKASEIATGSEQSSIVATPHKYQVKSTTRANRSITTKNTPMSALVGFHI
jgi:hypothetical protein